MARQKDSDRRHSQASEEGASTLNWPDETEERTVWDFAKGEHSNYVANKYEIAPGMEFPDVFKALERRTEYLLKCVSTILPQLADMLEELDCLRDEYKELRGEFDEHTTFHNELI